MGYKWVDGCEYERNGEDGVWIATGKHHSFITNSPRAGEPEGARDRKPNGGWTVVMDEHIHDACIVDAKAGEPPVGYDKARLLDTAKETVGGRGKNYGRPEDNFMRIANHWEMFLTNSKGSDNVKFSITPGDVAIMMALMKIARLENDPTHADSWIDLAGYAACGAEIETVK